MRILFIGALLLSITGCIGKGRSTSFMTVEGQSRNSRELGAHYLLYGDFGTLELKYMDTNILPWKVITTAMLFEENIKPDPVVAEHELQRIFKAMGFLYPDSIANLATDFPRSTLNDPIGIVRGMIEGPFAKIEGGFLSCAGCHAGVTYSANGLPNTNEVWLGLPNTSIHPEMFVGRVYQALKTSSQNKDKFMVYLKTLYGNQLEKKEESTINAAFRQVKKRLDFLASRYDKATPFYNAGPGSSNGAASLKYQIGALSDETFHLDQSGVTSIPNFSNRQFKTAFLYDGAYGLPGVEKFTARDLNMARQTNLEPVAGVASLFLIAVMGVDFEDAKRGMKDIKKAFVFYEDYKSPKFPGEINAALATKGQSLYHNKCASCHGHYQGNLFEQELVYYPNKLIPLDKIGTDPVRAKMVDKKSADIVKKSVLAPFVSAEYSGGYMPPILDGIWATAPYLHNGSIPTLWHLMNPGERPNKFLVGGHSLDFNLVGIRGEIHNEVYVYPSGYQPFSTPLIYDTAQVGQSNKGHERQFEGMSRDEKLAIMEYLKLL